MHLSPYNRSYLKLLPSLGIAVLIVWMLSGNAVHIQPDWVRIVATLFLSYLAFSAVTFVLGLDADDRLIANAVWARVRGTFRR